MMKPPSGGGSSMSGSNLQGSSNPQAMSSPQYDDYMERKYRKIYGME